MTSAAGKSQKENRNMTLLSLLSWLHILFWNLILTQTYNGYQTRPNLVFSTEKWWMIHKEVQLRLAFSLFLSRDLLPEWFLLQVR